MTITKQCDKHICYLKILPVSWNNVSFLSVWILTKNTFVCLLAKTECNCLQYYFKLQIIWTCHSWEMWKSDWECYIVSIKACRCLQNEYQSNKVIMRINIRIQMIFLIYYKENTFLKMKYLPDCLCLWIPVFSFLLNESITN